MEKSKAETFVGFAIRSGKYKIGFNACATLKRANLLIVCSTASENSKKEAISLSKKLKCQVVESVVKTLSQLTHRENAKIMAITDTKLAQAILSQTENDFIERY